MLPWISSLWHSQHWAEITLCHHTRTYHHNALFLLNSPIPLVSFSSELNNLMITKPKKSRPFPNLITTCSSEPHLIANLRCYFADFPYLLSSTTPKAVNLGDLLRSWVRSIVNYWKKSHSRFPLFFKVQWQTYRSTPENRECHFSTYTLFSDWLTSKVCVHIYPHMATPEKTEKKSPESNLSPISSRITEDTYEAYIAQKLPR